MKLNETQKELLSLIDNKEYLKEYKLTKLQLLTYAALYYRDGGYTTMKELTGGYFTQSNEQLLKLTGIGSKTTLTAALRKLDEVGLIERVPGKIDGRIATAYRLLKCTDKCTDKKCTGTDLYNLLKDIKLNKKCTDKCTGTDSTCTIDIEQDIEKEQLIKENSLLKEELDKVKKELEEVKREKNFKNDNMMIEKSNLTLTGEELPFKDEEVGKDETWFGNLITSNEESNKMMEGKEIVNCPSNEGSNNPAEPEEKNKMIPSNEDWRGRKAAQDELKKEFDSFIDNLKNLTVQEREKNLASFKMKAESVFTGKYVDIYKDNFQKRYNGYTAAMAKNNPSKAKARKEAQPCNNESIGVAAAAVNSQSLTPPVAPVPPSPSKEQPKKKINLQTCSFDEFTAYIRYLAAKIGVDEIETVTENLHNAINKNIALTEYDRQVLKYDWSEKMKKLKETASVEVKEPTIKDENTHLSSDSIFNKMKYELNHIETAEDAKDWEEKNKNTIQKLEPQQREELKKIYFQIYNAA